MFIGSPNNKISYRIEELGGVSLLFKIKNLIIRKVPIRNIFKLFKFEFNYNYWGGTGSDLRFYERFS